MSKVAFITGAGGYIGSETAITLAKQGIKIAVNDICEEAVNKTVEKIKEIGGEAIGYVADIAESESITQAINKAKEDFGSLDMMIHIAGGSARIAGPEARYVHLVEQEDYVIERVLKVNLFGAFWASRAAARIMIEQGTGGKIINFSSTVGVNGGANCSDYAAAKGGIMSLTKALAKELGPHKINVNSVAPGIVMRPEEDGGDHRALGTNLLGEKCTATDVANLVEFLVSDRAGFITGQTYIIDGGRTLSLKGTD